MEKKIIIAIASALVLVFPILATTPVFACAGRKVDLSSHTNSGSAYIVKDNCGVGIEVRVACYAYGLYDKTIYGKNVYNAGATSTAHCSSNDTAVAVGYRWWGNDRWNYVD